MSTTFDPAAQLAATVERAERCAARATRCAASALTAAPSAAAIDTATAADTAAAAVQHKDSALVYAEMYLEPGDAVDLVSRALVAADAAVNAAVSAELAAGTTTTRPAEH